MFLYQTHKFALTFSTDAAKVASDNWKYRITSNGIEIPFLEVVLDSNTEFVRGNSHWANYQLYKSGRLFSGVAIFDNKELNIKIIVVVNITYADIFIIEDRAVMQKLTVDIDQNRYN